jgi:nitroreductase
MELHEAIRARASCRAFLSKPVPDEALQRVLNAARYAVSVANQQPWRFILVRDEEKKKRLSQAVTKGHFLLSAPLVVVALGVEEAQPALVGGYMLSYPLDVAAAIQNLLLAATAEGLGSCWCTEFKEDKIRELFEIPEGIRVVGVIPLGYPDPTAQPNGGEGPRRTLSEVMAFDHFAW